MSRKMVFNVNLEDPSEVTTIVEAMIEEAVSDYQEEIVELKEKIKELDSDLYDVESKFESVESELDEAMSNQCGCL